MGRGGGHGPEVRDRRAPRYSGGERFRHHPKPRDSKPRRPRLHAWSVGGGDWSENRYLKGCGREVRTRAAARILRGALSFGLAKPVPVVPWVPLGSEESVTDIIERKASILRPGGPAGQPRSARFPDDLRQTAGLVMGMEEAAGVMGPVRTVASTLFRISPSRPHVTEARDRIYPPPETVTSEHVPPHVGVQTIEKRVCVPGEGLVVW